MPNNLPPNPSTATPVIEVDITSAAGIDADTGQLLRFYSTSGVVFTNSSTTMNFPSNIPSHKQALIDSKLLFVLTKAGRNILGYIIDRALRRDNPEVVLDVPSITEYLTHRVEKKQANYFNIRRGIKDLIEHQVITMIDKDQYPDTYRINQTLISEPSL